MTKRIVAVTGEYVNRDNEQKAEFTEIGVIGVGSNGKEYVILDPTVSIAGVMAKQNALAAKRGEQARDSVMASLIENQPQQQGGYQQQQPQQQGGYQQPQGGYQQQGGYNQGRG